MDIKTILKCIFIPFYWRTKTTSLDQDFFSTFYGVVLTIYMIVRLGMGISHANHPKKCKLHSIGDVIISPMYTIGCNIGKNRFDIKVN